MRTLVVGDIHNRYDMMMQLFDRCNLDYEKDFLIIIGDVVDGLETRALDVVQELLKIKNRILVVGNHDLWFMNYMRNGNMDTNWLDNGGDQTLESYNVAKGGGFDIRIPDEHKKFFFTGRYYYVKRNMVFVHGGFDPNKPISEQIGRELTWDRQMIERYFNGRKNCVDGFDKIFVGHTQTTINYGSTRPVKFGKLWDVDTGAGWDGKLTVMDRDTEEYWQSDVTTKPGRR